MLVHLQPCQPHGVDGRIHNLRQSSAWRQLPQVATLLPQSAHHAINEHGAAARTDQLNSRHHC
jgi:hypothetical protein